MFPDWGPAGLGCDVVGGACGARSWLRHCGGMCGAWLRHCGWAGHGFGRAIADEVCGMRSRLRHCGRSPWHGHDFVDGTCGATVLAAVPSRTRCAGHGCDFVDRTRGTRSRRRCCGRDLRGAASAATVDETSGTWPPHRGRGRAGPGLARDFANRTPPRPRHRGWDVLDVVSAPASRTGPVVCGFGRDVVDEIRETWLPHRGRALWDLASAATSQTRPPRLRRASDTAAETPRAPPKAPAASGRPGRACRATPAAGKCGPHRP